MSVLAGFITIFWKFIRSNTKKRQVKRRRKGKLNKCAKILEKNKNIEAWNETDSLIKADYTEERWQRHPQPAPPSHCCSNENCGCQMVREYTKALIDNDDQKAEEIRKGEYTLASEPLGILEIQEYEEEPKVKLSKSDIQRLEKFTSQYKNESSQSYERTTKVQKKKKRGSKHQQSAEQNSSVSLKSASLVKRRCCDNEQCGCHDLRKDTTSVIDRNTAEVIVKGLTLGATSFDRQLYAVSSDNGQKCDPKVTEVAAEIDVKPADIDSSFHHQLPNYYHENENALNHMKKKKRTKKVSKKLKIKAKKVSSKGSYLETAIQARNRRYKSLVEESDSSYTDETVYTDHYS